MLRGFRSPRRLALSLLASCLAVVWTAQTLVTVFFREPADPNQLRAWMPMAMLAYVVWHLLKAALRPLKEPMEWTSAETEWLIASPLSRRDLLGYRLSTIATSASLKAICFAVIMIPDLHLPMVGALAMLAALMLIDFLRLAFEQFAWALSPAGKRKFAIATLMCTAALVVSAMVQVFSQANSPHGWFAWMQAGVSALIGVRHQWWAYAVSTPFRHATEAILSTSYSWALVGYVSSVMGTLVMSGLAIAKLDRWANEVRRGRERSIHQERALAEASPATAATTQGATTHGRLFRLPRLANRTRSVIWMQALGMRHFAGSLAVSFVVPAALTLAPLVAPIPGVSVALQIGGALAFYSFVLLPTALKFDFRRNIDRLVVLKQLPLSSWSVTLGQLATPVITLSLFQASVLGVAVGCGAMALSEFIVVMTLLVPANVLVLAIENLIFLAYPYRLSQEGVEIFLRTVLMFTGKGLMMVAALAGVLAWSLLCQQICQAIPSLSELQPTVFLSGLISALAVLAFGATALLKRAYHQFDVSCDLPT